MKFILTASSISSIAISSTMMLRRLRKMPTTLIAKRIAPRIRKCDSVSGAKPMPVVISFLLRRHGDQPHPVGALGAGLRGGILRAAVLAPAQGERDRGNDRHQQDHRGDLEGVDVLRVQH